MSHLELKKLLSLNYEKNTYNCNDFSSSINFEFFDYQCDKD